MPKQAWILTQATRLLSGTSLQRNPPHGRALWPGLAALGGVWGVKQKELVGLGMAVALRCEDCMARQVEALVKAGASRAEVSDVLAMSIQMGGGPAMMYAAKAMVCFDQMTR